jgi:hypothetical protein
VGSHHGVMAGRIPSFWDLCDLLLKICLCGLLPKPGSRQPGRREKSGANHCADTERSAPAYFSN